MGAIGHDGLAVPGRVDLAHEPAFKLGNVTVHPGTRQITNGTVSQTLEPRVMQVLVALARANGAIVTRVAMALAMDTPSIPAGARVAVTGGVGYFKNRTALATAISVAAGLGYGFNSNEVGARAGFQFAW